LLGAVLCIAVVSYGQVKYSKVRSALDTPYVNIFNDTPPQVGRANYLTMTIYVSNATYAPALDSATVGHLYVLPDISPMSEQSAIGDFKTDVADIKAEPYGFTLGPRQRATYYIWGPPVYEQPLNEYSVTADDLLNGKKAIYAVVATKWRDHGALRERHFCQAMRALRKGGPLYRETCRLFND
jgi:hypothetical protein